MKKFFIAIIAIMVCNAGSSSNARVVDGNVIMDQAMPENFCALTFDDGPSRNTPQLLEMLKAYNVPATFFLLGSNAQYYPELVRQMQADGHEIGNHTWSHRNLRVLGTDAQANEIEHTDELLRSLGVTPLYMRPPYGSFDERTVHIADKLGVSVVLWSLDSKDWKHLPPDYARLISTRGTIYEPGALRGIFLFHDTHKTTVDDLPRIIANLRAGGCKKFVTVSEYLAGIADPEPAMVLSRNRPQHKIAPVREVRPMYAAGSGNVPLARCSKPWTDAAQNSDKLDLEEAHAQIRRPMLGM